MDYVSRNVKSILTISFSVPERRKANRAAGRALVAAGIPVVPTREKAPVAAAWPNLDSEISEDKRQTIIAEARAKNGFPPMHVGSTLDAGTVDDWTTTHDFTPSVSLGAAGLAVLDLDIKNSVDGVESGLKWLAEHGVDIEKCPRVRTQGGGLHLYFSNPGNVGCGRRADLQWDLKGVGGQVVAPGAVRESDGKRYIAEDGAPPLADAFRNGSIPPIPDALVAMFRGADRPTNNVTKIDEARGRKLLNESDWPDFGELTDSDLGDFDLDALAERDTEWQRICSAADSKDMGGDDSVSGNLFNAAKCLHREFGDKLDLLAFASLVDGVNDKTNGAAFGDYVGDDARAQGQFNHRDLVRAFENARPVAERRGAITDGSAFTPVDDEESEQAGEADKPRRKIKSLAEFCAEYAPVEYVIDGLIERGKVYTLTAPTSAGKTTLLSSLALAVAAKRDDVLGIEVEQGRVVYCSFENPDDFRVKLLAAMEGHNVSSDDASDNLDIIDAHVTPGAIRKLARQAGECALVIVDTLQAAFQGDDSNSNDQVKKFVMSLRDLTRLPGLPAVMIAAHPVKNAGRDQLSPYGGGALLNEIDGNLTLWKERRSAIAELHWQGKLRGRTFEPKNFEIAEIVTKLKDAKGKALRLPIARPKSSEAADAAVVAERRDALAGDAALLVAIDRDTKSSLTDLAVAVGASKATIGRRVAGLVDRGFVKQSPDGKILTRKGRAAVAEAKNTAEAAGGCFEPVGDEESV